ncbi:MAG: tetratricopeptide repeat protein, partial [Dokdonella sp.]
AGNTIGERMLGFQLTESEQEETRVEGYQWLQKAADAGDAVAMNGVGYSFQNGVGVLTDLKLAKLWYQRSADLDNPYGIFNLGQLKKNGIGEPKDVVNAIKLTEKASALGLDLATCELGNLLVYSEGETRDPQRGWKLTQQAADAGNATCELRIGLAWRYGNGSIQRDFKKAAHYLELASKQGLDEATAQLAEVSMHENEDDAEKIREGIATLKRLAEAGNSRAQFLMAEACVLGRPWPRDMPCARHYFEMAEEAGFATAASNLGLLREAGIGGTLDLDAAESSFRHAISLGEMPIRYELGRLLLHKSKNSPEAIELMLAIAAEKNIGAIYVLVRYCREHPDCSIDAKQHAAFQKQLETLDSGQKNDLSWGLAVDVMSDIEDARYAIRLIESLPAKKRKDWAVIDTLAAAHARAGEHALAAELEQQSIDSLPITVKSFQRKVLQERLNFYKSGKTWDLPY